MKRPGLITCARVIATAVVLPRIVRSAAAQRPGRVTPARRAAGSGDRDGDVGGVTGVISVVIPARDEAHRIGPVLERLERLERLDGRYEVIVVDDGSTDDTAAIARRRGARVVDAGPRPHGWAGKTWAMRRGVEAATGEWIVHVDADVRLPPRLPEAAVAYARRHRLDVVTVTTCAVAPPCARWLHASMLATLLYRFGGPGAAVAGRELANGQCLVARRDLLVGPAGWAAVAPHVTEDVALVRAVAALGGSVAMIDGRSLGDAGVDMDVAVDVASFGEVWHGWGRSIGLPGVESRWRIALDVAVLVLTMPLPLARLVSGRADLLDVVLLGARWGTAAGVRTAYRPAGLPVLLAPVADPLAVAAVAASVVRRHVMWRGRRLVVPAPRARPAQTGPRRRS